MVERLGAHHLKDLSSSAIEYWELKEFVDRNGNHSSIHWISLDNRRVSIDSSLFDRLPGGSAVP